MGRPLLPRDSVTVMATCVQIRARDQAKMTFLNPRAPRKPSNYFERTRYVTLRINYVDIDANLE